ncbi:MAG: flagellar biosynthetic protein FliR [Sphingomonadales bacterium]|nr:flagellar biosynthetic protein FliR [Sphingomonadales bacterium]
MMPLSFGFGPLEAEFWRWVFLMTRIGAGLLAVPIFGAASVPAQVRVMIAAAVAALVAGWTNAQPPAHLMSAAGLMSVGGEVLVGLTLGFVLQFAFAAPTIAAEVIGGGMGLSMASTIDPHSGASSPALGQYFAVILTLIFLGLGGHLQWIALVVKSYSVFPPGQTWLGAERFAMVAGFASDMLAAGVVMALPVTLVLLLVQVLAGVLSRSAPALNLFSLGLPAGIVAGFMALVISAPMVSDRMADLTAHAIATAGKVIEK